MKKFLAQTASLREKSTEEQMEEALRHCASEPIHIPNSIQPHGVMLVARRENDEIVQISTNAEGFLKRRPEDCIGKTLSDVLGADNAARLNKKIRVLELQPLRSLQINLNERLYDAVTHFSGDYKIVELEILGELEGPEESAHMYEDLRDFATMLQGLETLEDLYNAIVRQVRSISKFDRVKLYQFDPDWNGMIVAEDKADFMPSYLGLNFPSTDIPDQARKLYSKNYLRLIADTTYQPTPLYPPKPAKSGSDEAAVDMSFSILRSVSPVHIQYLENIGVHASMSISIMQNGVLWGLIACHHNSPHHIPYRIRVLAELIGHIFSAKLSSLYRAKQNEQRSKKSLLIERMATQLNGAIKPQDVFYGNHDIALDALSADGFAIMSGSRMHFFGDTPNEPDLKVFMEWVAAHSPEAVVYTRHAEDYLQQHKAPESIMLDGGFLSAPIGMRGKSVAVWFRKGKTQKVNWAGNPEKPVQETVAGYRLTPRSSFELWQTMSKGKSDPWGDEDIEAAQSIANVILESEKLEAMHANSAKTDFLSSMSHEMRTPLGAVIGVTQILHKDPQLNTRQKELVSTLDASASALLGLVNNLLDIAKIEANEITIDNMRFRISQLMEDIRSMMRVKAQEKGLSLNIQYDRQNPYIFNGDFGKIRQILINLINNALKFTEEGFVNLSARIEEKDEQTALVTFEVADSGIGIPADKLDDVFKKFTQADSSVSRKYGGTGLGLTISQNLTMLMGGRIHVDSKEGMGTRFSVALPLRVDGRITPETTQPAAANTNAPLPENKKRVLLVEDYEGNVVVVLYYLQEEGYEVVIARNGKEAIQKLEKQPFDLIVMDVQMPVMDGWTATRIIRERQATGALPTIPIIGMTANALLEDRQKCLDAGMSDYIAKPLDLSALGELLRKNLDA